MEVGRKHPLSETLGELARESQCAVLRGLTEEAIAHFIEATTGIAPATSLVTVVHAKTEGNPFFVSELVRLLDAEGRLQGADEEASWKCPPCSPANGGTM